MKPNQRIDIGRESATSPSGSTHAPSTSGPGAGEAAALPLGECAALIGLDWGDTKHAFAMRVRSTGRVETGTVQQAPEQIHKFLDDLRTRFGGRAVAVAVETSKGAVIAALMEHAEWLTVYPVHPSTSRRFSQAFSPSGAKDDLPDANVLLDILSGHRHKLRALIPHDPATRRLGSLSELRRALVDQRTRISNQLTSLLKQYYPQALALTGDKRYAPLSLDFLERWPEFALLQKARPDTVRSFLYAHNVRREEAIAKRLEAIAQSRPLTTDRVLCEVGMLELRMLVGQLRLLQKQIAQIDASLAESFAAYEDASLSSSLPSAGAAMAPRLSVLFGTDRVRWTDATQLQTYYGIAPVTQRSGKQCWVHWRWSAPLFARQTLIEWAAISARDCAWARDYYERQLALAKGRGTILRALAFKWLRILWSCWKHHTPYDDSRYLACLQKRCSQKTPST